MQTTAGLPGPLVRVTTYCAPTSWTAGSVHPTVIDVPEVAVAVVSTGADSDAALVWAGAEPSEAIHAPKAAPALRSPIPKMTAKTASSAWAGRTTMPRYDRFIECLPLMTAPPR